jgi:hypothetical protein
MKTLLLLISLNCSVLAAVPPKEVPKDAQKQEQKVEKLSYAEQAKINKQKAKEAEIRRANFRSKLQFFLRKRLS